MTISTSEAGKRLADARPLKEGYCAVCGKAFTAISRRVYCSNACRQKAKYQRNKAEG